MPPPQPGTKRSAPTNTRYNKGIRATDLTNRVDVLNPPQIASLPLDDIPVGPRPSRNQVSLWDGRNESGEHYANTSNYEFFGAPAHTFPPYTQLTPPSRLLNPDSNVDGQPHFALPGPPAGHFELGDRGTILLRSSNHARPPTDENGNAEGYNLFAPFLEDVRHADTEPRGGLTLLQALSVEEFISSRRQLEGERRGERMEEAGDYQCCICLEDFTINALAARIIVLPQCGHAFHSACLRCWFSSHVTCPLCRRDVSK